MGNLNRVPREEKPPQPSQEASHKLMKAGSTLMNLPTFIYSYENNSDMLLRTHLVTGEESCYRVPSYLFKCYSCCSELPGGSLLITGGRLSAVREVVKIDTLREFAVSQQPPMLTPRSLHTCVYHAPSLYVLGGWAGRSLSACERFMCAESRWESVPPLPIACYEASGVVVEGSLYALGGFNAQLLDFVQKLRLEQLTWECLELRLPHTGSCIPCLKSSDTEVYLVMHKTLYSFTPLRVLPVRSLPEDNENWSGNSYYCRGTLYCANYDGAVTRLEIGSLN
jgi:hypothetical protein